MKAVLRVRVVPNARRTEVVGLHGEAIKIKVQAPAIEGKANEALRAFLSEQLRISSRDIAFLAGAKSRDKLLEIAGLEMAEIHHRLLTAE